jgi:hypothetical protein
MNYETVSNKIKEQAELDFGSIFSRSIELFKQVWVQGLVTLLLTFVCMLPFYILLYLPMIAMGISDPQALENGEMPPTLAVLMLISAPIFSIGMMVVGIALNAAFLRICKQKDHDEMAKEDYFFYLKKGNLRKLIVLSLLTFGIALLGMLACGIGLIYVIVPISMIPAFLAFDKEMSPIEIIKSSFELSNKNWLVIFGLVFIMGILAQLGILLCFIGVLFTAMLSKVPAYFIYKDGIGFPIAS